MKATKRKFTLDREEAVRMVLQEHKSVLEAARQLEINDKTLGNWVRWARQGKMPRSGSDASDRKSPSVSELDMEVSKLRAENTPAKNGERDFKKATAFFVRESQ
jgi:transposase